jgi:hypothetical protein
MAVRSRDANPTPAALLRSYLERFEPAQRKLISAVRTAVRKRLPTANELLYDYGTSVVLSYSPTDRGVDAILSVTARAGGVALYFTQGKRLPDPRKLLKGSAKQVRFIELESARQLATPDVAALIASAIAESATPLPTTGGGELTVRATAAAKRASQTAAK